MKHAKKATDKPQEGYPCQHGEACVWKRETGVNVTCSRLIAGCAKQHE